MVRKNKLTHCDKEIQIIFFGIFDMLSSHARNCLYFLRSAALPLILVGDYNTSTVVIILLMH